MYNNIGLATARGSGTNGYIQRNMAHLPRPRQEFIVGIKRGKNRKPLKKPKDMRADPSILDHERKRKIESLVFEERCKLEDQGLDESLIDTKIDMYRQQLLAKFDNNKNDQIFNSKNKTENRESHRNAAEKLAKNRLFLEALELEQNDDGDLIDLKAENRRKMRVEREAKRSDFEKIAATLAAKERHPLDHRYSNRDRHNKDKRNSDHKEKHKSKPKKSKKHHDEDSSDDSGSDDNSDSSDDSSDGSESSSSASSTKSSSASSTKSSKGGKHNSSDEMDRNGHPKLTTHHSKERQIDSRYNKDRYLIDDRQRSDDRSRPKDRTNRDRSRDRDRQRDTNRDRDRDTLTITKSVTPERWAPETDWRSHSRSRSRSRSRGRSRSDSRNRRHRHSRRRRYDRSLERDDRKRNRDRNHNRKRDESDDSSDGGRRRKRRQRHDSSSEESDSGSGSESGHKAELRDEAREDRAKMNTINDFPTEPKSP